MGTNVAAAAGLPDGGASELPWRVMPPPSDEPWRPSERALRYWSAILVVVIGIICGATIPGTLGGTVCTAIVGVGLVTIVTMVFYDVGLSEDRDREAERRRRRLDEDRRANRPSEAAADHDGRPRSPRPGRLRSHRGRLR